MNIKLYRVNDAVHLVGKNDENLEVHIDGSANIGGQQLGVSPMQLLLMSLGGCTSMDVLSILKKMKQEVINYHVSVEGNRAEDQIPAVFTDIHITYYLIGNLDEEKVQKAINLSMEKYCSVTKMLENSVQITHSFKIEKGGVVN